MNEFNIEQVLRKAPRVHTPAGLLNDLQRDIELPRAQSRITNHESLSAAGWFRRWLPTLGFAMWFLVCAVVFGIQAFRISELREQNRALELAGAARAEYNPTDQAPIALAAAELEQLKKDLADVERLRAEIEQLRVETQELAALRAQNQQLREELKTQGKLPPKPEEDFFATAAERASRIKCINNIKQVGLAARIWANDHGDRLPVDYDTMKAELVTDKVTFCPKDGITRYEILSPGISEMQPQIVYVRCSLHNNVGMVDGSAQMLSDSRQLVQRDGKWILVRVEFE